jgi:hypothetical protein
MSATNPAPTHLCDLSSEQLDRRAREHVDGFFGEVRGVGEHVRTEWHPLNLARKHPVATAAVIGVAGFAVARLLRGKRRAARGSVAAGPNCAAEPIGRTVGRSLLLGLAGAAATMLPELLVAYLRRRGGPGGPEA